MQNNCCRLLLRLRNKKFSKGLNKNPILANGVVCVISATDECRFSEIEVTPFHTKQSGYRPVMLVWFFGSQVNDPSDQNAVYSSYAPSFVARRSRVKLLCNGNVIHAIGQWPLMSPCSGFICPVRMSFSFLQNVLV